MARFVAWLLTVTTYTSKSCVLGKFQAPRESLETVLANALLDIRFHDWPQLDHFVAYSIPSFLKGHILLTRRMIKVDGS